MLKPHLFWGSASYLTGSVSKGTDSRNTPNPVKEEAKLKEPYAKIQDTCWCHQQWQADRMVWVFNLLPQKASLWLFNVSVRNQFWHTTIQGRKHVVLAEGNSPLYTDALLPELVSWTKQLLQQKTQCSNPMGSLKQLLSKDWFSFG